MINAPDSTYQQSALEGFAKYMTKIQMLVEELNTNGVRYCHWKSNLALSKSLMGEEDIDLLVHREDASQFKIILSQLHFRPAVNKDGGSFPSIEHFFALDEESGVLAHVHSYFRVITGDSLTKNYRFPIEQMLLENTRFEGSMRVPVKSAELIVFTLRMMLKHTSLVELVLVARYWEQVKEEIAWLLDGGSIDDAINLLDCWLPALDPRLFLECVTALKSQASLLRRIALGMRLKSGIKMYARRSAGRVWLTALQKFTDMVWRRLTRSSKELMPGSGGAVIAFVGSEATGKSTLLDETRGWLGEHFAVKQIHAGKPKSTALTLLPNLLVPALRSLFPTSRSTYLEAQRIEEGPLEKPRTSYPLIFIIRSLLLAYDRRTLLSRAFKWASNGNLVLCDRYPSLQEGVPDSPQLSQLCASAKQNSIRRWLACLEARWYREIPTPDVVVYLTAPLDVTLSRNAARGKREPEEYVRRRHSRSSSLEFERTPVHKINTDQPFEETALEVKKAIWNIL